MQPDQQRSFAADEPDNHHENGNVPSREDDPHSRDRTRFCTHAYPGCNCGGREHDNGAEAELARVVAKIRKRADLVDGPADPYSAGVLRKLAIALEGEPQSQTPGAE